MKTTMDPTPATSPPPTFDGYVRSDGRVGTRNHLGVFIVGNCAATAARKVADWFTPARLTAFPNVDGVVPFVHELGCGMEKSGEPMDLLRRTLGGSIRNPNLAGAVVLALGCERNNIRAFLQQESLEPGPLLHAIVLQEVGGTARAIEEGIAAIESMLPLANAVGRTPVPASQLTIGLQAGDVGPSSPAQAALGIAVDLLVQAGGTAIVSATADIAKASALVERSVKPGVREALEQRIQWWDRYTQGRDTRSTRREKSIVPDKAMHQLPMAGHSPVQAVYGYAHAVTEHGLVFMDSPRYEAVSATGQVASGANLVCVLAATGSSFGAAAVPTVKLAANGQIYGDWEDDLDIDGSPSGCGPEALDAAGRRIFTALLDYASGRQTKAEELGVGENEFVPWPVGVFA